MQSDSTQKVSRPVRGASVGLKLAVWSGVLFLHIPLALIVLYAFSSEDKSYVFPPPGLTTQWFVQVLQDPEYLSATWTSLWLAGGSTAASLVLGLAGAYAIHHRMVPGASMLRRRISGWFKSASSSQDTSVVTPNTLSNTGSRPPIVLTVKPWFVGFMLITRLARSKLTGESSS